MKTQINNLNRLILSATVIGGMLFYSSCEKDKGPIFVASTVPVSFSSTIQPIFTANCIGSGCHNTSDATAGLDLSVGNAYSNLVNVASGGAGGNYNTAIRVVPSNAASSILWNKVANTKKYGGQMPSSSALASGDISNIQTWINQGAKNN